MKVIFGWDGKFNLAGKLLRVGVINLDGSDRPIGLHCLFFRPLFLSFGRQNRTKFGSVGRARARAGRETRRGKEGVRGDDGSIIYDDSPNYEDGRAITDDASKGWLCRI